MTTTPRPVTLVLLSALLALAFAASACSTAQRASLALNRGEHARAVALYEQALAKDPQSLRLARMLGLALVRGGQYDAAMERFAALLADHPGDPFATFYMGLAHLGKGDFDGGAALLEAYNPPARPEERRLVREAARTLPARYGDDLPLLLRKLEQARDEAVRVQDRLDRKDFISD